jgi:hypothetical protein
MGVAAIQKRDEYHQVKDDSVDDLVAHLANQLRSAGNLVLATDRADDYLVVNPSTLEMVTLQRVGDPVDPMFLDT